MPIRMDVQLTGAEALRIKMANPEIVREPMRKFLKGAGNLARADVRPRIPKGRTGRARRSVRVFLKLGEFRVTVFSKLFYVKFLAGGTKNGIVARRMFRESSKAIQGKIQGLARQMLNEITLKLAKR